MRRVNYALRKNRRILEKCNQWGLEKVEKRILAREGFNFEYITHLVQDGEGHQLYFCYDRGYQFLNSNLLELVSEKVIWG